MQSIIGSHEFLHLSALLNYQLAGIPIDWRAILAQMVKKCRADDDILFEALIFLRDIYGSKRRKIGPLMILHPLRIAAMLAKINVESSTLDILTALFHDLREDMEAIEYSESDKKIIQIRYASLAEKLDEHSQKVLEERITLLTKGKEQDYHGYLEQILNQANRMPELLLIKLMDRLDNTFDLRMDLNEEADKAHFYTTIFNAIFTKSYKGPCFSFPHPMTSTLNGAKRLFQLYKNILFLSLLQNKKLNSNHKVKMLFESLIMASSKEAQDIILHIFSYHLCAVHEQKELLMDCLAFILGKTHTQTLVADLNKVGGVFHDCLNRTNKIELEQEIGTLYKNKKLMCQTALIFLIIFSNFLNDPEFSVSNDFDIMEILGIRNAYEKMNGEQVYQESDLCGNPRSMGKILRLKRT